MSTVSRFGSFSRDLRYGEIGDDQFHAIFDSKVMFTDALKCVFAPPIQSQDVRTTGTYTYGILKFSSSPHHFVQSIGALPGGIGRSGMVCSKELDLCYNFIFTSDVSKSQSRDV